MAGFAGMPLGSFSGRGADFQPFQFIMQLRQRQAEQEQARKEQAQAAQQSFLMAVMSQKQQQQALAQRQQEAMMQREMEQQNQARLADQFRSEQSRLQGAEQRRLEMEREALGFQRDKAADVDARARADDEFRAKLAAKKEQDSRNLVGVSGDVGQIGEGAMARFGKTKDELKAPISAEIAKVERAMEGVRAAWQSVDPSGELPASEPYRRHLMALNDERSRLYERLGAVEGPSEPVDPLDALGKAEAALRLHAGTMLDPQAKALYLEKIAEWREGKRAEILKNQQIEDYRRSRDEERARKKDADEGRALVAKNKAALAKAKARASVIQGDGGLLDRAQEALYMAKPDERKAAQDRVDALTKELEDLYTQLAELE